MFGLFRTAPVDDPQLGRLMRRGGAWWAERGVRLDGQAAPLAIAGSRSGPDPAALAAAKQLDAQFAACREAIARGLHDHFTPYAGSVDSDDDDARLPAIDSPADVWPHARLVFVNVAPLSGELIVELGYAAAWDDEHTLGARLSGDRLVELNGSVLPP